MRKHLKHFTALLLVFTLVLPSLPPIYSLAGRGSGEGDAKHNNVKGWWDADGTAPDGQSVAQYIYHHKSKFKGKINDGIANEIKEPDTFIIRKKYSKGYRFYLCWLVINDLAAAAKEQEPRTEDHNFGSNSGNWETCGYAITKSEIHSGNITSRSDAFYFNLTTDGYGKYSDRKQYSGRDLHKNYPTKHGYSDCLGGHCQIWKDPEGRHSDYGVVLHYQCLYDPADPDNCLMGEVMNHDYPIVRDYTKDYPFGYVKAYVHAIPARKNSNPKPIYDYNEAKNFTAHTGEITKTWNEEIHIPVYPTVRVRAVDLSTNTLMDLPADIITKIAGSDKKYYGNAIKFSSSHKQLQYDAMYVQTNDTEEVKRNWGHSASEYHYKTTNGDSKSTAISTDETHKHIRDFLTRFREEFEGNHGNPWSLKDATRLQENKIKKDNKIYVLVGADAVISNYEKSSSHKGSYELFTSNVATKLGLPGDPYGSWSYFYNKSDSKIKKDNEPVDILHKYEKDNGKWTFDKAIDGDEKMLAKVHQSSDREVRFMIEHTGMKKAGYKQTFYDGNDRIPEYVVTFYYLGSVPVQKKSAFNLWYIGDGISITDKKLTPLPHIADPDKASVLTKEISPTSKNLGTFEQSDIAKNSFAERYEDKGYDENGIIYSLHGYNIQSVKKEGTQTKFTAVKQDKLSADTPWNKHPDKGAWNTQIKKYCTKGNTQDLFYTIVPPVVTAVYTQQYSKDGTYTWKKEYGFSKPKYFLNGIKVTGKDLDFGDTSKYKATKLHIYKKNGVEYKRELEPSELELVFKYVENWKVKDYNPDYDASKNGNPDKTKIDEWRSKGKPFSLSEGFNMPKSATVAVLLYPADEKVNDNTIPKDPIPETIESTEPQPITPVYNDRLHPLHQKEYTKNDPSFSGPTLPANPQVVTPGHNDFNGSRSKAVEKTVFDLSKLEKYGTSQELYHGKWSYMSERWQYNSGQPWVHSKTSDFALPLTGMERNAKVSILSDEKKCSSGYDARINIPTSECLKTFGELNKYEVNIEIQKIKTTYRYSGTFTYVRWECHDHQPYVCGHCGYTTMNCNTGGICPETYSVYDSEGNYLGERHYSHSHGCLCHWEKHIYNVSGEVKRDTIYYQLADGAAYYPTDYTTWNDCLGEQGQQTVYERDNGCPLRTRGETRSFSCCNSSGVRLIPWRDSTSLCSYFSWAVVAE